MVFAAGLILLPLAIVHALTVSPVMFEFDIAKGASKQDKIRLWNETNEPQTYEVVVRNFVPRGEEGEQEYIEEEAPTGLASWVAVDRQSVTLAPDALTELSFAVRVPDAAEPGGHYAAIFLTNGPARGSGSVGVSSRIGVLLLVNVPGEIREEAQLESFRLLDDDRAITRLPANFELRLRNLGSTHLRPQGSVIIRNLIGWEVARLPVNPKESAVLPGSVRRINPVWDKTDDGPPSGGFWTETKNEWRNFALGRYTATVDASYGSKNAKLQKQTISFWVFPWHLAVVAGVVAAGLFLLARLRHALMVRAALKRDAE